MLRSILVPLDGSTFSARALPLAAALAARDGATLYLVSAYTPLTVTLPFPETPVYDTTLDVERRARMTAALQRYARYLRAECLVSAGGTVRDGDPAEVLATEARRRNVDLIVMTTHGRGGVRRAWMGSVADALLRRAAVPVLLIRPTNPADTETRADDAPSATVADPLTDSATPGTRGFRRVLVPLDGSALAEAAVEPALELGDPDKTRVLLLRVIPAGAATPSRSASGAHGAPAPRAAHQTASACETAAAQLASVAARVRRAGYTVEPLLVLDQDPAACILAAAAVRDADLIAMATHGRSGVVRAVLGSVTDRVMRGAPCPVLVVRPDRASTRAMMPEACRAGQSRETRDTRETAGAHQR